MSIKIIIINYHGTCHFSVTCHLISKMVRKKHVYSNTVCQFLCTSLNCATTNHNGSLTRQQHKPPMEQFPSKLDGVCQGHVINQQILLHSNDHIMSIFFIITIQINHIIQKTTMVCNCTWNSDA